MGMKQYISIVILITGLFSAATAQAKEKTGASGDKKHKTYRTASASYIAGAQVYNDNFLYNPGGALQISSGWRLKKDLYTGFGAGYTSLQEESFVPLFWEAYGFRSKKRNSPYIKFQAGYAPGWIERDEHQQGYEMRGGLYFSAAAGRKIKLNDKFGLLFQIAYTHQDGELEYEVFGSGTHVSELNFDMLWFSVGMIHF